MLLQYFWVEANHRVGAEGSDCSAIPVFAEELKGNKEKAQEDAGKMVWRGP